MRALLFLLFFLLFLPPPAFPGKQGQERQPTTIVADRLEVDRKQHKAVYSGNVILTDPESDLTIRADRIQFFFDEKMEAVKRAVATGRVQIVRGSTRARSERAEYFPAEEKAILTGNPRVWQGRDHVSGSRITLFLGEDRALVERDKKQRVKAVIYPRRKESR